MTELQKKQINDMRQQGCGYKKIGQKLGISSDTIRSYCRRNMIDGSTTTGAVLCKQCGKRIKLVKKRKPRIFCSDSCRITWWNSHPDCVNQKAIYHFECIHCGKAFTAYGNRSRKYCNHACYIAHRYGGEVSCES